MECSSEEKMKDGIMMIMMKMIDGDDEKNASWNENEDNDNRDDLLGV